MCFLIRKIFFTLLVCLLLTACEDEGQLTESNIREMVAEIETAAANYDANRIGHYLSDDFICDMTIMTPAGEMSEQLTKKEYLVNTTEGWASIPRSAYHYSATINSINIRGDSAVVTSTQEETISVGYGQNLTLHSNVVANVAAVNNQLRITKISMESHM